MYRDGYGFARHRVLTKTQPFRSTEHWPAVKEAITFIAFPCNDPFKQWYVS